jgi:hypothetical protein
MSRTHRLFTSAAVIAALAATPAAALASSVVRSVSRSDRSGLIRALVREDGTSRGVTGVYISRSHSGLGVVCQRTPDGGKVSYVFKRGGRSWSYLTSSRASTRSALYRQLEHAC